MRLLLVGHDAGGTVPPLIAIGQAAVDAGHDVMVLGQPSMRARAEAVGARFTVFSELGDYRRDVPLEHQPDPGVAAIAGATVGVDLRRAADEVEADVIVVDANLGGALAAAESLPQPSAVLLHSMYATFVATWFADLWPFLADGINASRAVFGLDPVDGWAAAFARHDLLVSVVPEAFEAPVPTLPETRQSFGFLVPRAPAGAPAATFPPGDGPTALVSLSTTHQQHEPLLGRIVAALAETDVRALVTTGGHLDTASLRVPPNVVLADFVPHQSVLPAADVVVTHAGLGTVAAALAAGVPLVCTPIARDQHLNTERVEALGVGIGCPDGAPAAITPGIDRVLGDPAFGARAAGLASESRAAGGAPAVVDSLAALDGR
ncbi:MAG TPA: glycosyltransferase [Iamia sp.]